LVTKVINILIPNQHAMILIIFKSYDDWGWLNAYDGWDKWVYNVMKKTLSNFPSKHAWQENENRHKNGENYIK
jgi:hypothetical protein